MILSQSVYDKCGAAILVFDVTDYRTLKAAKQYLTRVKGKVGNYPTKFLLVGNKVCTPGIVIFGPGILLVCVCNYV